MHKDYAINKENKMYSKLEIVLQMYSMLKGDHRYYTTVNCAFEYKKRTGKPGTNNQTYMDNINPSTRMAGLELNNPGQSLFVAPDRTTHISRQP